MLDADHFEATQVIGAKKTVITYSPTDLTQTITDFKAQNPNLKKITVSADDKVQYLNMVKLISSLAPQTLPIVFAGKPD